MAQVEVAIAAGLGLREIARNMGIPRGTVLAHAKRKGLRLQIEASRSAAQSMQPEQSTAITMQQREECYAERMAGVSERVLPHLESLPPNELLDNAWNLEQIDRIARRTFRLEDQPSRPSGESGGDSGDY